MKKKKKNFRAEGERKKEAESGQRTLRLIRQAVEEKIEKRTKQEKVISNNGWQDWLTKELGGDAAGLFHFIRLPQEWRPQNEESREGEKQEDEVRTLQREAETYKQLWKAKAAAAVSRSRM